MVTCKIVHQAEYSVVFYFLQPCGLASCALGFICQPDSHIHERIAKDNNEKERKRILEETTRMWDRHELQYLAVYTSGSPMNKEDIVDPNLGFTGDNFSDNFL